MDAGADRDKLKRLDLLGGIGAGVLGAGLALMFAEWLQPFALPALGLGIATHGWAMFRKARLERQAGTTQPAWADMAEGACWIMLAGLFLYIAYRVFL